MTLNEQPASKRQGPVPTSTQRKRDVGAAGPGGAREWFRRGWVVSAQLSRDRAESEKGKGLGEDIEWIDKDARRVVHASVICPPRIRQGASPPVASWTRREAHHTARRGWRRRPTQGGRQACEGQPRWARRRSSARSRSARGRATRGTLKRSPGQARSFAEKPAGGLGPGVAEWRRRCCFKLRTLLTATPLGFTR